MILAKYFMKPSIPVINIRGIIDQKQTLKVTNSLKRIRKETAKAVAVVINSPGGSPCQCDLITQQIKRFCKEQHLPLYTFAEDIAASGGYYLLSIGDKVYVDQTSLVGSIGAIISWVGFKKFITKHNIDTRRFSTQDNLLHHILDSVNELEQNHKNYLQVTTENIHKQFIQHVENYRGKIITLSAEERQKQIYNADIFLGSQAVKLGFKNKRLADAVSNYQTILNEEFPNAEFQYVTRKTVREKYKESRGQVNIKVNLEEMFDNKNSISQNLTNQFLKEFK